MHKIKLKSRVFCLWKFWDDNRDTLCFVIVQFHLEDMVVEVLLKMPCVKHGIRGENANLFWCLEEPKDVYFPKKRKTGEFLINQWYPKMYAENSHALQVFKKFIRKNPMALAFPASKLSRRKKNFFETDWVPELVTQIDEELFKSQWFSHRHDGHPNWKPETVF